MDTLLIEHPHFVRQDELTRAIADNHSLERQLGSEVAWYDGFDPVASRVRLCELLQADTTARARIADLGMQIDTLSASIDALRPALRLGWNPLRWLTATRLRQLAQLWSLRTSRTALSQQIIAAEKAIDNDRRLASLLQEELERHAVFDLAAARERLRRVRQALAAQQEELFRVSRQCQLIARQLREVVDAIAQVRLRLDILHSELAVAKQLEAEMGRTCDPAYRRYVHERCKARFACDSPRRVVSDRCGEIDQASRTLNKLEERLAVMRERVGRRIAGLVIDGNNLCFQQSHFVGLDALRKVAAALAPLYPVTIVFDASIRKLTRNSDAAIAALFPASVAVHIVAVHTQADETILEAAARDGMYVISNDRFNDYRDKAAVAQRRLITHEIVNNRVMIHDLNVQEDFRAAPLPRENATSGGTGGRTGG